MSVRKYYKLNNPTISSTSSGALCYNVQRTFSESAFSDIDLDYKWNYTSPLDEVSDDDNSNYIVKGTSQFGVGSVSLTVTPHLGLLLLQQKTFG